jgi:hypothetical protein
VERVKIAHRKRVTWAASVVCFLVVVLATSSSSACTYSYDPKEVNRKFSVEITDHGRGIADLHLEVYESMSLSGNSKPALEAITDGHGVASFKLARPGAYRISIKNIELSPDEEIVLKRTPSTGALKKIAIQLPDNHVLSVRSISGSIHGQVMADNLANSTDPLPIDFALGVKLTLIRARSEEIVESHLASESGSFSFSALPDGLYFLHLEAPAHAATHRRALDGYIPITIDPSAKVPNLNLYTFPGICTSLAYRNRDEPSSS